MVNTTSAAPIAAAPTPVEAAGVSTAATVTHIDPPSGEKEHPREEKEEEAAATAVGIQQEGNDDDLYDEELIIVHDDDHDDDHDHVDDVGSSMDDENRRCRRHRPCGPRSGNGKIQPRDHHGQESRSGGCEHDKDNICDSVKYQVAFDRSIKRRVAANSRAGANTTGNNSLQERLDHLDDHVSLDSDDMELDDHDHDHDEDDDDHDHHERLVSTSSSSPLPSNGIRAGNVATSTEGDKTLLLRMTIPVTTNADTGFGLKGVVHASPHHGNDQLMSRSEQTTGTAVAEYGHHHHHNHHNNHNDTHQGLEVHLTSESPHVVVGDFGASDGDVEDYERHCGHRLVLPNLPRKKWTEFYHQLHIAVAKNASEAWMLFWISTCLIVGLVLALIFVRDTTQNSTSWRVVSVSVVVGLIVVAGIGHHYCVRNRRIDIVVRDNQKSFEDDGYKLELHWMRIGYLALIGIWETTQNESKTGDGSDATTAHLSTKDVDDIC